MRTCSRDFGRFPEPDALICRTKPKRFLAAAVKVEEAAVRLTVNEGVFFAVER
jgi:hypothetical protein